MLRQTIFTVLLFIVLMCRSVLASEPVVRYDQNWPQWRGPLATGLAPAATPPLRWSEDENIRWKRAIPGNGLAAPVIWGEQVFILTAVATNKKGDPKETAKAEASSARWMKKRKLAVLPTMVQQFVVLALDRKTGRVNWQRTARTEQPHEGTHRNGSWASNSPVTDGEFLFAYFGSRGLYCYDLSGNLKWQKDLGNMRTRNGFGEGSSPALHGDVLVVNWDQEDDSFIVAMDKRSGEELWRRERDEVTSWSTPVIVAVEGKPQVVINATNRTRGYDLQTGEVIWEIGGMTVNTIPSPVHDGDMAYVMSGFRGSIVQAIRLAEAKGDLSNSNALAWTYGRDAPYVPSPLLYGDHLYFLKANQGILSCLNAKDGTSFYGPVRLEGIKNIYSSPVAANDRVYLTGRSGTTVVLQNGQALKVLATNTIDDKVDTSAAIAGTEIYLRGHNYLYCISED